MSIAHYIRLLRPSQWLKNALLFFPPFLGGQLTRPGLIWTGVVPLFAFCLASSSTYVVNDLVDAGKDLNHPTKKRRPLPSGVVSKGAAGWLAGIMLAGGVALGWMVSGPFLLILLAYLVVSTAYSVKLKQIPIVDIFCISTGFILRLEAGGEAFRCIISEWLFLSVFLLSIFLSIGKRLSEKTLLGNAAGTHRQTLLSYPDGFLDGAMYLVGAAALVTYTMYTVPHPSLVYSVPLCTFGLLRYIFRVKSGLGGDPTESLLKDFPLLVTGVLWAVMIGWNIYV